MKNLSKELVVAVIIILIGLSIPSTGATDVKQSVVTTFNDGSLSGYVNDTFMNPIKGVKVRVYFHGTYEESYSDSSGYYHVTNIPICNCTKNCTAFKSGYKPEWVWLSIQEDTSYNFVLTSGNTSYVGGSGPGNYSEIQDAIDNATAGDTVFVFNDSSPYYENVIIDKTIALIGENQVTTRIDANKTGDVITITADHVTIDGFNVANSGRDYDEENSGIKVLSNESIIINTTIVHCLYGIFLPSSNQNHISYNTINYNSVGIRMKDAAKYNIISNNTLESWSFDYNIYIYKDCNNNLFSGNTIINYDGWGVYSFLSDNNMFYNNSIKNSEKGISLVYSNHTIVKSNLFQNNEEGLYLTCSTDVTISQNTFVHDGVFFYKSFQNIVTDNTVNDKLLVCLEDENDRLVPENAGQIILINCSNVTIRDHEIKDTTVGIELWNSLNCEITHNSLIHNIINIYLYNSDFNNINGNTLQSNKSYTFRCCLELNNCKGNTIKNNDISITDRYTYILISNSRENVFSENNITCYEQSNWRLILTYSQDNSIADNILVLASIRLFSCENTKVVDNTIQNGSIDLDASEHNTISRNSISEYSEDYSIKFEKSNSNIVTRNTISDCKGAFSLIRSRYNCLTRNNIVQCGQDPAWFSNSLVNLWLRNYWDEPSLGLKIIRGEYRISRGWPYSDIVIPVFTVDLFPRFFPLI